MPLSPAPEFHSWKPIEPLSEKDRAIDLVAIRPLYESWRAAKERLERASPNQLAEFNRRLVRRLSVETGILERLYDLDRGTTEALVLHGFAEDLITHSATNVEPSTVIGLLRDHESAVQLVMDCVSQQRPLTVGLIHQLHEILTRHQDTTAAVDQFGRRIEITLLKGAFKAQPNNPRRQDGSSHEYCPPIHVASEMDNLISWLTDYSADDPVIVAAWLHHRFTQIHPYQDGNGRLARALITLILLRAGLLPLVVDRDLRTEYIGALEAADSGELNQLASLFARLERHAILQALSVDTDAEVGYQKSLTSAVIGNLADRLSKRREQKQAELRQVNQLALELRGLGFQLLKNSFDELRTTVEEIGEPQGSVQTGGSDLGNGHWYRFDVGKSAKEVGTFPNFAENHYFLKSTVRVKRERLVFVVSLHHVGRDLTGIMEATAFAKLESFEDSDDREIVSGSFFVCATEPFVFTWKTMLGEITASFSRWLDAAVAVAIKEYGDRL